MGVNVGIDKTASPEKRPIGLTRNVVLTKDFSALGFKDITALSEFDILLLKFAGTDFVISEDLRDFVKWLTNIEITYPTLVIRIENLPPSVARQLIPLRDYLPQKLEVLSMFVPFCCDDCDHEDQTLLVTSQQARAAHQLDDLVKGPISCQKCNATMEPEIVANKYLSLMLERAKW
jgi:hypothetical protein